MYIGERTVDFDEFLRGWGAALQSGDFCGFGFSRVIGQKNFLGETNPIPNFCYDNNPELHHREINGCHILPPEQARGRGQKIVIFAFDSLPIKRQLMSYGLVENIDFIDRYAMAVIDYYLKYRKACLVGWALTIIMATGCTMKCANCSQSTPYNKNVEIFSLEQLKHTIDLIFAHFDKVENFGLIGGEPLLNKNLCALLEYMFSAYEGRLRRAVITTNGTLPPPAELLELCGRRDVIFNISDYRGYAPSSYDLAFEKTVELISSAGIHYELMTGDWNQFVCSEPTALKGLGEDDLRRHFNRCLAGGGCSIICDGLMHICNVQFFADKFETVNRQYRSDILSPAPGLLNLRELKTGSHKTTQEIIKFALRLTDDGQLPLCRNCYGYDYEYITPAARGEQQVAN